MGAVSVRQLPSPAATVRRRQNFMRSLAAKASRTGQECIQLVLFALGASGAGTARTGLCTGLLRFAFAAVAAANDEEDGNEDDDLNEDDR